MVEQQLRGLATMMQRQHEEQEKRMAVMMDSIRLLHLRVGEGTGGGGEGTGNNNTTSPTQQAAAAVMLQQGDKLAVAMQYRDDEEEQRTRALQQQLNDHLLRAGVRKPLPSRRAHSPFGGSDDELL